jgi:hypothetical protein
MSSLQKWVSGHDLLKKWNIMDSELIDCLKKGLKPFRKYNGLPILCPEKHHAFFYYNEKYAQILEALKTINRNYESAKGIEAQITEFSIGNKKTTFFQVKNSSFMFEITKTDYENVKNLYNIETSFGGQIHRTPIFIDNCKVVQLFKKIIDETKAEFQSKIEDIKSDDPNCILWKYFIKPREEKVIKKLCDKMTEAVFKLKDVEKFEGEQVLKPQKKLRPNQKHKIECRKVAGILWKKYPNMTIADIINRNEIIEVSKKNDGNLYTEKTVRNWIKDLCPDRSAGRRRRT